MSRKKRGQVNDTEIYKNKYYPWYYTSDLRINLVPISYYCRLEARITLGKQFPGSLNKKEIYIIKGSQAIKNGWKLGRNSFFYQGKRYQVKKMIIPPEYAMNRSRRRLFVKKMRSILKNGKRSARNKYLKKYIIWIC